MNTILKKFNPYWKTVFDPQIGDDKQQNWSFIVRIFLLAIGCLFFNIFFKKVFNLPYERYQESSILLASLKHLITQPKALLIAPLIGVFIYFRKRSFASWEVFPLYHSIRFIALLAVVLLAWIYSTYDINLYFNQVHLTDRLLLLLFIPLIWWRPIFVFPFLAIIYPVIGQFAIIGVFSWVIPSFPIHILTFFGAYFMLFILTKSRHKKDFIFLIVCLFAAHYWHSGWAKMDTEWLLHDPISLMVPASYARGWLHFLTPDQIASFTNTVTPLDPVFRFIVILVEFGCLFLLMHRKLAISFLLAFAALHLGIFLYTGICLWIWVILDIGLLILLIRKDAFSNSFAFNKIQVVLSILLIISSKYWTRDMALFWHDVSLTYTYKFEGKGEDGNTYQLPPSFFAPYDYQFIFGGFNFLHKNPLLPVFGGEGHKTTAKWLRKPHSVEDILEYEKQNGQIAYDENLKIVYEQFLRQYTQHWNAQLNKKNWMTVFQTPRYVWAYSQNIFPNGPVRIRQINAYEVTTLFHDGQYKEIRRIPILEMPVED